MGINLKVSQNLVEEKYLTKGMEVTVTEETISRVTRLPQKGDRWIGRRSSLEKVAKEFTRGDKIIQPCGKGYA